MGAGQKTLKRRELMNTDTLGTPGLTCLDFI